MRAYVHVSASRTASRRNSSPYAFGPRFCLKHLRPRISIEALEVSMNPVARDADPTGRHYAPADLYASGAEMKSDIRLAFRNVRRCAWPRPAGGAIQLGIRSRIARDAC